MAQDLLVYTWTCPICGEAKLSMTPLDRTAIERQAENAFLSHVRTTDGDGHGKKGSFPPDFDPSDALDHVDFNDEIDDRKPDLTP